MHVDPHYTADASLVIERLTRVRTTSTLKAFVAPFDRAKPSISAMLNAGYEVLTNVQTRGPEGTCPSPARRNPRFW